MTSSHPKLALLASFGALLIPCLSLAKAKPPAFTNMQKNVVCPTDTVVKAESEAQLVELVKRAQSQGVKLKAASQGWMGSNPSSCVASGGIQVDTSGFNRILAVDPDKLQVKVQPGIKFWDLNQALHSSHQVMIPAVQEYADVTIGGMLGNGTHGSSLGEASSSLQDRVIEARLIDGKGQIRVITGPELDYIGTHLGVLGIITEVTLAVQPSFKLEAKVSSTEDKHLEDEVLPFVRSHYAGAVTWFPGQGRYATVAYNKVANSTPGNARNGQAEKPWFQQTIFPEVFKAAHLGSDNRLLCFLENQRMKMKEQSFFTEEYGKTVEPAVGWAHDMLSFVCRDRCTFDSLPFALEEIAIPMDRLPEFIKDAKTLFAEKRSCFALNGIYFRFGKAGRAAISMASGRDTVYVGMEYIRNPYGQKYPKDFEAIQELEQILLSRYEGRPHWGKNTAAMFHNTSARYPRWQEFLAYREQLDPDHIFTNEWFEMLAGDRPVLKAQEQCVANEACYCTVDTDCPSYLQCAPGLIEPSARVCRKNP